uniref:Uncharacterized protein n=1 Tax=Caenorhabditis tropicalis TaxID=1561998 RepID=A0A1I7T9I8_9PELO
MAILHCILVKEHNNPRDIRDIEEVNPRLLRRGVGGLLPLRRREMKKKKKRKKKKKNASVGSHLLLLLQLLVLCDVFLGK